VVGGALNGLHLGASGAVKVGSMEMSRCT
jgi:hypothetical protein